MSIKGVEFIPGKWKGNPPKGKVTPRRVVGEIRFLDTVCEILVWEVKDKDCAFQIQYKRDQEYYKLFFTNEEQAIEWMLSQSPEPEEIYQAALKLCEVHDGSTGTPQRWLTIKWNLDQP